MKELLKKYGIHLAALGVICVWGTSFVASRILLYRFTPVQVMFMRFVLAYVALWVLHPHTKKLPLREELKFLLMGLTGNTIYFMAENTALTHTATANVSIIIAFAPVFTAVIAHFVFHDEKLTRGTFLGFGVAIVGVALVVFNGVFVMKLSPVGDLLTILAALSWAAYSVMTRSVVGSYNSIFLTRRVMFWGIVSSLPVLLLSGGGLPLRYFREPKLLFCVLFLALVSSAACYVVWNRAIAKLGTVVANNYIYLNPFVTMVAAWLILDETIKPMGYLGAVLILLGVIISDRKKQGIK